MFVSRFQQCVYDTDTYIFLLSKVAFGRLFKRIISNTLGETESRESQCECWMFDVTMFQCFNVAQQIFFVLFALVCMSRIPIGMQT